MNATQMSTAIEKQLSISIGSSRKSKTWKTQAVSWERLLKKLSKTVRTKETQAEYIALPKSEQDEIKDVGGFVGGTLKGGRRLKGQVSWRSLITLDADHVKGSLWDGVEVMCDYAIAMYSTHKHTSASPRLRLVIPLAEPIAAEQYEPVARKIAEDLGIDFFDDTTYEAHRLMYWPSTSEDGVYEFQVQDGSLLDPSEILERYREEGLDWRDPFHWPRSSRETVRRERERSKAGDPGEKPGLVGAFCRAYTIHEAIETFLSEVYSVTDSENRYTYTGGSTYGGVVTYDDAFSYSHHESDPAGGELCNSFDLVRLHYWGDLDKDEENTTITRKPSYKKMVELAGEDAKVQALLLKERRESAADDFAEPVEDDQWEDKLDRGKNGFCRQTIANARMILDHDPSVAGKIAYNEFSHAVTITEDLPWHEVKGEKGDRWRDVDDAGLRLYMEQRYGITHRGNILDAFSVVAEKRSYHPIREYLESLTWDGEPRVEKLLIDYLAAEDSEYVRTVTRKMMAAAVARVMTPGVKWDYMLTLYGKQGVGKSFFVQKIAKGWHSDSVTTFSGKEAYEQLQGAWILEVAELTATRKSEAEATKHFISKQEDMFRVAYGRNVQSFPRQCIFIGTTNDPEFLRDKTGNRRFWPVKVGFGRSDKSIFTMSEDEVDLVWAEAVQIWKGGERLALSRKMEAEAGNVQSQFMEENPKIGQIVEFLDMALPANWDELNVEARRRYIHGTDFGDPEEGAVRREKVCAMEVLVELFEKDQKWIKPYDTREVNDILRVLPGWREHEGGEQSRRRFRIYGRQKAFDRTF